MMKKLLMCIVIAAGLSACSKEDNKESNGNITDPTFADLLKSKTWTLTNYTETTSGFSEGNGTKNFFTKLCLENSSVTPDPCNFGIMCNKEVLWNSYQATFTENTMNASFSYHYTEIDSTSDKNCTIYYSNQKTGGQNFANSWSYQEDTKKLSINFGDVFGYYNGDTQALLMDYEVKLQSASKIVLEGIITQGSMSLKREITLE